MINETQVFSEVVVISVHDEEEPIHFSVPMVVPSRYDIPGVNAPKTSFDTCKFSLPGEPRPVQYAFRRTKDNHPYVLIKILEPHTFIHGTEQQKADEYGQRLQPDVMRVPVPVPRWRVADEIERVYGVMGVKAINGEVTEELIKELEGKSIAFMRSRVTATTLIARRAPQNVTPQAIRSAWKLFKLGLLNPVPEWAQMNPDAKSTGAMEMLNCPNCGLQVKESAAKCQCGAILNWKRAVELGFVTPGDVPESKRAEAGLSNTSDFKEVKVDEVGPSLIPEPPLAEVLAAFDTSALEEVPAPADETGVPEGEEL